MSEQPLHHPHICSLPIELIIRILRFLNPRDLLRCQQVCRLLNDIISESAELQYIPKLMVAGLEDGPPSAVGPAGRFQMLQDHQQQWDTPECDAAEMIPMYDPRLWELYGGVLVQAQGNRALNFMQLSSVLRGIEQKTWTISDVGCLIADFSIDPAQDLLVIVEDATHNQGNSIGVHLRTMHDGTPHPAASSVVLTHQPSEAIIRYSIRICQDFVGIRFGGMAGYAELLVWNWKSGTRHLCFTGGYSVSFDFLSDRHILLGVVYMNPAQPLSGLLQSQPHLAVVDLLNAPSEAVRFSEEDFLCIFHFPPLAPSTFPLFLEIFSDPAPSWTPQQELRVPFHLARGNRLFVVSFQCLNFNRRQKMLFFVLLSTIMSFVNSVQAGERVHHFLWEEWGPAHTYMMYAPRKHNEAWPNFVYGTKYAYPRTRGTDMVIEVMDFNPLPMIRHLAGLDNPSVEDFLKCGWVNRPSWTDADDVFVDRLEGTLPFRVQTLMPPPIEGQVEFRHVMISEDSLITLGGVRHANALLVKATLTIVIAAVSQCLSPNPLILTQFNILACIFGTEKSV